MTDPNQPFEPTSQSPADPVQTNTSPSTEPVGNQLLSQTEQESYNIINEIIDDITNKTDIDVIVGVVACVLALLFFLLQITRSISFSTIRLFFTLSVFTPALAGWALRAGYGAVGKQRVKLYALGGFAFGIYFVSIF